MSYSAKICITIPSDIYDIGCSIARALDPDLGGFYNFGPKQRRNQEGEFVTPTEYTTGLFPCTQNFADQAPVLMQDPSMLHQVVVMDYQSRWPSETVPSLADCTLFCNKVIITFDNDNIIQG